MLFLTRPIILTPRFSNSSLSLAKAPSSVVQTGVKSAGWEKRIVQLLSMNLWKSISPWVVRALKLGAIYTSVNYSPLIMDSAYRLIPVVGEAVLEMSP